MQDYMYSRKQYQVPKSKSVLVEDFLDPDENHVAVLDIETSGLKADWDVVISTVVDVWGKPNDPQVFEVSLQELDMQAMECDLMCDLMDYMADFDGVISFYGLKFDIPFLRARAIFHDLQPIGKIRHLDLYPSVKNYLYALSSRRLERLTELAQVADPDGTPMKTKLKIFDWAAVVHGRNEEVYQKIIEHNIKDVEALKSMTLKMYKWGLLPDRKTRR
jgi:uncharacterized protein YprB with RNaseH-like and TPR domain